MLVVAPSRQLREQLSENFSTESVLRGIGALPLDAPLPSVEEVQGRAIDWESLRGADVVVALPDSISPAHHQENPAPRDLFDLIVVDEAHHSPAPTWRAILDHWNDAKGLLLSATPRRRDGKRVPGDLVFHYPLRRAIEEGSYKAVQPEILELPAGATKDDSDRLIVARVRELMDDPEHATSTLLVRAGTETRARELVKLYNDAGVSVELLVSRLGDPEQRRITDGLRSGQIRAVAVVGMLGEGFDLPSLRLAAYHDKHKSLNSTVQLIGRLVRVHDNYPQPSVLVTTNDADVYPALKGIVRTLWDEDTEWAVLLPQIADAEIERGIADKKFANDLESAPPELALEALRPMVTATVFESRDEAWVPRFVTGDVPTEISPTTVIRGREVFYASVTPDMQTLLVIMRLVNSPRWNADSGLDSAAYELYLLTWVPRKTTDQTGLLLVNGVDGQVTRVLLEGIGFEPGNLRIADPRRLQDAFDSLPRISVSNVGVRNTYGGGRGAPTYKTFAGSAVDRGLREADTAQSAIGHAMAQVQEPGSTYTTGISTGKGKFWEARYVPLRVYQDLLNGFAERYWSPTPGANPLLPDVARGSRIEAFPTSDVVAIEMNPNLVGFGWSTTGGAPLELVDLQPRSDHSSDRFALEAVDLRTGASIWMGYQDTNGEFYDDPSSPHCAAQRGYSTHRDFPDLLSSQPPSIYFYDGTTIHGHLKFAPVGHLRTLPTIDVLHPDWTGVDIKSELDSTALAKGVGISVSAAVVRHIQATPSRYAKRWILGNDGSGEIADFIVLEVGLNRQVRIGLWHVKPSKNATPAVRVPDMQVVTAQAIKSRRWLTDLSLWEELGRRLDGESSPRLVIHDGSERLLRVLLGRNSSHPSWALDQRTRLVRGEVVIVQPGLSWSKLDDKLAAGELFAQQVRDLLAVFDDAVGQRGDTRIACSP